MTTPARSQPGTEPLGAVHDRSRGLCGSSCSCLHYTRPSHVVTMSLGLKYKFKSKPMRTMARPRRSTRMSCICLDATWSTPRVTGPRSRVPQKPHHLGNAPTRRALGELTHRSMSLLKYLDATSGRFPLFGSVRDCGQFSHWEANLLFFASFSLFGILLPGGIRLSRQPKAAPGL